MLPGSPIDVTHQLLEHGIPTADNLPAANIQKYKYTVETDFNRVSIYQIIAQNEICFNACILYYSFIIDRPVRKTQNLSRRPANQYDVLIRH